MKIAIAGGSGFVGSALTKSFIENGHVVYILTRQKKSTSEKGIQYVTWLTKGSRPEVELENIDVLINLAGTSLNSGRWTDKKKEQIYTSRMDSTRELIRILCQIKKKPSVFINASAIGYYGISRDETFTETETKHGSDFLASTVHSWEDEAKQAKSYGVRTVFTRFGIVLGETEGALPMMVLPYKFYVGGTVGSGEQWLSWVHIDDVVGMITFAINNNEIEGPLNVVAPNPAKMKDFGKTIAKAIRKPHWLPAPSFVLKLLLGEMSILVLEGQKVLPEKAVENGYQFFHSSLDEALTSVLQSEKQRKVRRNN